MNIVYFISACAMVISSVAAVILFIFSVSRLRNVNTRRNGLVVLSSGCAAAVGAVMLPLSMGYLLSDGDVTLNKLRFGLLFLWMGMGFCAGALVAEGVLFLTKQQPSKTLR